MVVSVGDTVAVPLAATAPRSGSMPTVAAWFTDHDSTADSPNRISTGFAVSAGYDCDNQAATVAGLIGVIHGAGTIPDRFTRQFSPIVTWQEPFNNLYINYTRDNLPIATKISDIVDRIAKITERAIWENGGRKISEDGEEILVIQTDF